MKGKLIVLLLILTAFKQPIVAQPRLRFGLLGGLNGNLIHATYLGPNSESKPRWDYTTGVSVDHWLTSSLTLGYNLLYSRQGGAELITSKIGYGSTKMMTEFSYLTLPVMVRYHLGGGRFFISGGPQIGYLLKAKWYAAGFESSAQSWDLAYMRRFDVGLTGGLGYRLGRHVVLESRYYYGLNPFNETDPQTNYKEYNRTWASNLVYYF
ncbi:porin family protein [Spirosoma pollinicola]|uniref:Outer membrane protein beta-barrel domain-containing protein n=1 Tax=Spirosoma pollinicola TaxID=2057025 RepID=A0A2K8Z2N4_9BACT|nr:porin family protein [Spirosoma pollinicola]AUD04111.1 hypothetical protein CWM47_21120 [Spirosoma pollinicola]